MSLNPRVALLMTVVGLTVLTTAKSNAQLTVDTTLINPGPSYDTVVFFGVHFPVTVPADASHTVRYKNDTGMTRTVTITAVGDLLHGSTQGQQGSFAVANFVMFGTNFSEDNGTVTLAPGKTWEQTVTTSTSSLFFVNSYLTIAKTTGRVGVTEKIHPKSRGWSVFFGGIF